VERTPLFSFSTVTDTDELAVMVAVMPNEKS
jgi:hypothetical protein